MAKVKRADGHFTHVENAWKAILTQPGAYSFETEIRDDGREHIYRAVTFPEVDPDWGLILGDCAHNLRSALDHLAWQLVRANNGVPKSGQGGTQFPISTQPRRIRIHTTSGEVDPDAVTIIDDAQPRHGRYDGDNLLLINELDIMDKHHHLIVTEMGVASWWKNVPGQQVPTQIGTGKPDPTGGVKTGDEIAGFSYATPLHHADPNLELRPGVTFVEGPLAGQSFKDLGTRVRWMLDDLLPRFAQFF